MDTDHITLSVPTKGEYAKTVRLTAASLAGRMEMSYDDVDDVRIAAEEAFVYASDTMPDGGQVELHFILEGDLMRIEVPLGSEVRRESEDAERRASYATFILQSVCDRFELASDEEGTWLRLEKRANLVTVDGD
jgi:serine/threonine-protein kinase RsbW